MKVFQLEVKSNLFKWCILEEIYVEQPKGFVKQGEEEKVYLFKKVLYGLKQVPGA